MCQALNSIVFYYLRWGNLVFIKQCKMIHKILSFQQVYLPCYAVQTFQLKHLLLVGFLLLAGSEVDGSKSMNFTETNAVVYVVKYRWHTAIVFNRLEAQQIMTGLKHDFKDHQFIEIGWGDKDFYMAPEPTFWHGFKAIFWPTQSVLHVHGFNNNPEWYYNDVDLIRIQLPKNRYEELLVEIKKSFALDSMLNYIMLGPGLLQNSAFYLSNEKYYLFKTCNYWLAKKLKKAGLRVCPFFAITSKSLLNQLKRKNKLE